VILLVTVSFGMAVTSPASSAKSKNDMYSWFPCWDPNGVDNTVYLHVKVMDSGSRNWANTDKDDFESDAHYTFSITRTKTGWGGWGGSLRYGPSEDSPLPTALYLTDENVTGRAKVSFRPGTGGSYPNQLNFWINEYDSKGAWIGNLGGQKHPYSSTNIYDFEFSLSTNLIPAGNIISFGISFHVNPGTLDCTIYMNEESYYVLPVDRDTDGNGVPDSMDPDDDGDGMPDTWEIKYGLDPKDPLDAHEDLDGDGLSNLEEYLYCTDPTNPDTDGDGWSDYDEIKMGSSPTSASITPEYVESGNILERNIMNIMLGLLACVVLLAVVMVVIIKRDKKPEIVAPPKSKVEIME